MKRAVASSTLWTVSAAAAVGLGFLAVSLVDADASPVPQPIAATEPVTAAPSPSSSDSGVVAAPTPTSLPPAAAPGEYTTVGGTVFASCDGGLLQVAAAPAAGWWVDDQDQHGEVEFEGTAGEVEVHVACADGAPAFRDEGVRSGGTTSEDPGSSSSSAPPPPGVDDSAGRVGGGHGSDDPPGDDSAGRGDGSGSGSGSGSDD
jgi:hypothetical protein